MTDDEERARIRGMSTVGLLSALEHAKSQIQRGILVEEMKRQRRLLQSVLDERLKIDRRRGTKG